MSREAPTHATRSWLVAAVFRGAYLFVIAVVLAYFEVQVEGPDGWAARLPTWRSNDPAWTWVFGGRPITGYHLALNVLLLLFLHWPFLFKRWELADEARVIQGFAVLSVVWDFLWFVLNPAFGLSKYDAAHIWWFKHWFLKIPLDYFVGLSLGALIRLLPSFLRREPPQQGMGETALGIVVPATLAAIAAMCI